MPEVYPTVQAVEIKPGQYRWFGYPEKRFISGDEAIRRLQGTIGGFHGHQGQWQPYEAVAQTLGAGIPTPAHGWWKAAETLETPIENIERLGARQYLTIGTFMDPDGILSEKVFATFIGTGYDTQEMEERITAYTETGRTPPGEPLALEEQLIEVSRRTVQVDWRPVGGLRG